MHKTVEDIGNSVTLVSHSLCYKLCITYNYNVALAISLTFGWLARVEVTVCNSGFMTLRPEYLGCLEFELRISKLEIQASNLASKSKTLYVIGCLIKRRLFNEEMWIASCESHHMNRIMWIVSCESHHLINLRVGEFKHCTTDPINSLYINFDTIRILFGCDLNIN